MRFAVSPLWETQAAVQALADERGRSYHSPWLQLVRARAARLDLAPLLAVLPRRGYVPDFLSPPSRASRPSLRGQLAEVRAIPPAQVARELARCRETVNDETYRGLITSLLTDPEHARDHLAARLLEAWTNLVAPFWVRIRTLLDRDIEQRSRTLARHGLRRALDELHPKIRWTNRGLSLADRNRRTVEAASAACCSCPAPTVAARRRDHRRTVAADDHLPRHRHRRALADIPGPERRARTAARPDPRPCPHRPGPAALNDRARCADRAQPRRCVTPPARPARRRTPLHHPARARGPLPPNQAWIRTAPCPR